MPSAGVLLCLASAAAFGAMGIFGKLAYDEGATVGTLLATRFVLAAARPLAGRARPRARLRACAALVPPRRRHRARARRSRLRRPGRRLLRGARPPRRLAALPARVHLPGDGHGDRHRPRARAGQPAHGAWPWCSPRPGSSLVLAGARRARWMPLGTALGLGAAGRLLRLHPDLGGRRRPRRPARAEHAGVHRRGDHADRTPAWPAATWTRPASAPPASAGWAASPWCPRSGPSRCSSPGCGGWARPPRPSCPRSSRWSPWRWRSPCSASRSVPPSSPAAAWSSGGARRPALARLPLTIPRRRRVSGRSRAGGAGGGRHARRGPRHRPSRWARPARPCTAPAAARASGARSTTGPRPSRRPPSW